MSVISFLSQTGAHEKSLRGFFNGHVEYDGPPVFDHPLFCLGFFNRSGSNLLAGYLRATPYFSGFNEQLNYTTVENLSREWEVSSFPDYIRQSALRVGKGKFAHGYKASADQLMMLQRFGIPKMYAGGLKIIHITRQDLIGQTISYQIASQTRKWTSQQSGIGDDVDVQFDTKLATKLIDAAQSSDNGISMFAEIFGHPRLHVTYEDLLASPRDVLDRITRFAGQEGANWPVKAPGIERQASEMNERFRAAYLSQIKKAVL